MFKKLFLPLLACLLVTACDKMPSQGGNTNVENNENVAGNNSASSSAQQDSLPDGQQAIEDIKASSGNVEDDYANWLYTRAVPQLKEKCKRKGIDTSLPECTQNAFFFGDGVVMLPPEDPNWANARSLAYDKALIKAYQKAAEYLGVSSSAKMVHELFRDSEKPTISEPSVKDLVDNQNVKDLMDKFDVDTLLNKAVALAGGQLDKELRKLGVDPAQFNKAPESVKKTMLKDAIIKENMKSAIANTSGMVPYQTFEGRNQEGSHVIRVVISTEPDRIALLKSIISKQARVLPNEDKKSEKSLYEKLVVDRSLLVNQFGTRLMYDEEGYPALVAFGQAGIEKAASHTAQAARAEIAQRKAVAHADAALTLLLNSTTTSKEVSKEILQHLEEEKIISDKATDELTEELSETDTYNDYMDSKVTTSGHIENFAGRSEFYNWTYEMPETKQKIVGVILVWTPQTAAHAQNVKAGRSSTPQKKSSASSGSGSVPTNVVRGIESDF